MKTKITAALQAKQIQEVTGNLAAQIARFDKNVTQIQSIKDAIAVAPAEEKADLEDNLREVEEFNTELEETIIEQIEALPASQAKPAEPAKPAGPEKKDDAPKKDDDDDDSSGIVNFFGGLVLIGLAALGIRAATSK